MKYLVLDDEILAAKYLEELIREIDENAEIVISNNPIESLEIAKNTKLDVCFIDIHMPEINGIDFAGDIKKVVPKTNFIFVTGYSNYMGDAFKLDASDYIMKPANKEQVRHALENLRYSIHSEKILNKRVQIICFGNFEVFVDGEPVKFKFGKTKELLAYLVHRKGARCSSKEVIAALWEEDCHDSYYRMLKKDLQDVMENLNCANMIYSGRGEIGLISLESVECDYFKWIENPTEINILYQGEYMAQFSWAEGVNALIESEKQKMKV